MTTVFGEKDHTPFGNFAAELVYGRRPDGAIVHIHNVLRGRKCDCVCPVCDRPLIARKGAKTAHHFAHAGTGTGCGTGLETNVHIWAKEVLERHKQLVLPEISAQIGKQSLVRRRARQFTFETVRLEKRLGDIVPDVVLTAKGVDLIVEVFVTHRCDDAKIAKIRAGGISAIEVDLRKFRHCASLEEAEMAVLLKAPRKWLFNPKLNETADRLRSKIATEERSKAAAIENRAKRLLAGTREQNSHRVARLAAESAKAPHFDCLDLFSEPELSNDGFTAPKEVWRRLFIFRLVTSHLERGGLTVSTLDIADGLRLISDCLAPGYDKPLSGELKKSISASDPTFIFPEQTLVEFLELAENYGVVHNAGSGSFQIAWNWLQSLIRAREARERAVQQRQEAIDRINAIVSAIPLADRKTFSMADWLEEPVPGFGKTLDGLARANGDDWVRFGKRLAAIEGMLKGGQPVFDDLGLPLEAEIERATRHLEFVKAETERRLVERLKSEAEARVRVLLEAAAALGNAATDWLNSPIDGHYYTPAELARRDANGLEAAHEALSRQIVERDRRAAFERETALRRAELERAARKIYDDDQRVQLFIKSHRPELGGQSPFEACESEMGLKQALALLPRRSNRR